MIAKVPHSCGKTGAVGAHHSAFAGRDVLDRVEAEDIQIPQRSDWPPLIGTAKRVAGVDDKSNLETSGDPPQGIIVAGKAGIIHGHDRLRAWCHLRFDLDRVN